MNAFAEHHALTQSAHRVYEVIRGQTWRTRHGVPCGVCPFDGNPARAAFQSAHKGLSAVPQHPGPYAGARPQSNGRAAGSGTAKNRGQSVADWALCSSRYRPFLTPMPGAMRWGMRQVALSMTFCAVPWSAASPPIIRAKMPLVVLPRSTRV